MTHLPRPWHVVTIHCYRSRCAAVWGRLIVRVFTWLFRLTGTSRLAKVELAPGAFIVIGPPRPHRGYSPWIVGLN